MTQLMDAVCRDQLIQAQYFKVSQTLLPAKMWPCLLTCGCSVQHASHCISTVQDPFRMDDYLASNIFLPDINNERDVKNATYADNLASLERLVLYRFEKEYTVVPRGRCTMSAAFQLTC
jgi:Palmitoyl protein thioesterase